MNDDISSIGASQYAANPRPETRVEVINRFLGMSIYHYQQLIRYNPNENRSSELSAKEKLETLISVLSEEFYQAVSKEIRLDKVRS